MRSLPMARTPPRPVGRPTLRRRGLGLLMTIVCLVVPAATSGALPSSAAPGAAPAAAPAPRVLTDPTSSGISLAVSPADLAVGQGDVVHLHFAGLEANESVYSVGTCPAGLPVKNMDTAAYVGQLACGARISTGLTGDTDPASINNPGLSTFTGNKLPTLDGAVDIDFLIGSGSSVGTLGYIVVLKNGDRQTFPSLTCDATHACTIGFVVQRKDGSIWTDLTSLTFSPPPAGAGDTRGCSGLSTTATVTATGAERLQNPLATMDRAYCAATPSPIPVSYIPTGLGENDSSSVPAVGTTADLAFIGSPALAKNPLGAGQVRVPIALNAVSIAQLGGLTTPSLTPGQLASTTVDPGSLALAVSDVARVVLHDFPTSIPADLPTTPR
ncbi:MAG: hypothetical protein ABI890_01605, partial [Lapillicoccus sp.]